MTAGFPPPSGGNALIRIFQRILFFIPAEDLSRTDCPIAPSSAATSSGGCSPQRLTIGSMRWRPREALGSAWSATGPGV